MPSLPRRSQVSPRTVWTVGLNVLALVLGVYLLWTTWAVVSWILIALLLALALEPLVHLLEKKVQRRGVSVLLVVLSLIGMLVAFFYVLVPMLVEQVRTLVERAPMLLEALRNHAWFAAVDERFHVLQRTEQALSRDGLSYAAPVFGVLRDAVSGVFALLTILSIAVFMLLFGGQVLNASYEWVDPIHRPRLRRIAQGIHDKVGGYVAGSLLLAFVGGVVATVTAVALGVPYFLALGMAMALFSIIPFVGSAAGVALLVVTTIASEGLRDGLIALGVLLVYGQVKAKLLGPLVQRRTIQMNPLIITLVMLVGTALLGLLGTLLALPIAGGIQVVLADLLERRQAQWAAAKRHLSSKEAPPAPAPEGPAAHH
jgi:putative heme transporter